jgi:VWFA-related protein
MFRCLAIVLTAVTAGAAFLGAQEPTFHAGTHTVSVYATVVDRNGRLVTDLTKDDFQVLDNGKPQPLTIFKNDIQPITIVIMLDRSGSMVGRFDIERDAAERFVADLLPEDKARLGSFSNHVEIDPPTFTSDRDELIRILHGSLQEAGPTPLWNATFTAMNALTGEPGRRVVLVFTDGYDSPIKPEGNTTLNEVIGRSQTEEIMVYAIGLADACGESTSSNGPNPATAPLFQRGPGGRAPRRPGGRFPGGIGGRRPIPGMPPIGGRFPFPGPDAPTGKGPEGGSRDPLVSRTGSGCPGARPDPGLKLVAEEGGGGYFELHQTDDLGATFSRIADELHHQYLLAFTAAHLDGTLHHLEVRVRDHNLTPRARKSYLAAEE